MSISGWRKSGSSPLFPAQCRECGGESTSSGWSRTFAALIGEVLLWGSIIFALVIGSFYGLLLLPLGLVALGVALNKSFPLVPIDEGLTKARRRAISSFGVAIVAAVALVAGRQFS